MVIPTPPSQASNTTRAQPHENIPNTNLRSDVTEGVTPPSNRPILASSGAPVGDRTLTHQPIAVSTAIPKSGLDSDASGTQHEDETALGQDGIRVGAQIPMDQLSSGSYHSAEEDREYLPDQYEEVEKIIS